MDDRLGWGGQETRPFPIHHSPLFDQIPVVELLLPLFMATGGLDEAALFYFSQVNNSCPLLQPRESRNRGTDEQGSRWLVEPVRTLTLLLIRVSGGESMLMA